MKLISTMKEPRDLFLGVRFLCSECGTINEIEELSEVYEPRFSAFDRGIIAECYALCGNCVAKNDVEVRVDFNQAYRTVEKGY